MNTSKHRLPFLLAVVLAITTGLFVSLQVQAAPAQYPGGDLTPDEVTVMLSTHNDWRSRYGVPALVWDAAVASVAQDWANQIAASGNFAHRPNNKYGENIWAGTAGFFTVTTPVDGWGGEVADYDLATNTCAAGKVCGHFTQLVWANTARLGCGKATGNGNDYFVCNYDPPGNFVGQTPGITKNPATNPAANTATATVPAATAATTGRTPGTPAGNVPGNAVTGDAATFLNAHNDWRRKFGVPPLVWDDTVAAAADGHAKLLAAGTPFASLPKIPYGWSFWGGSAGFFNPADPVNSWGSQSENYDLATNSCAAGKSCGSFTQMVWSTTTKLGCAIETGNGNDYFVCAYDPAGNITGQTPGASLVPAPTLTAVAAALTTAPTAAVAVALTNTPTLTPTAAATAQLTPTTAITATAIVTATATITPTAKFTATTISALTSTPTLTPTATKQTVSGTTGLSASEATAMLDAHNEWRRRFGVPALGWDDTVASVAQDWANQMAATGNFDHRPNNKYGENIWTGSTGFFVATDPVNGWGNEVDNYDLTTNTCAAGKVCGHFTQVVWSTTTRVGCGKATGQGSDYYVCNYDPPGNFTGETPGISSQPLPLNTPTPTTQAGTTQPVADATATPEPGATQPDATATSEPDTTQPDAAPPTNTTPDSALDASTPNQVIPGNTTLWYTVPSDGPEIEKTIRIPGAANGGMMFMVFAASQIPNWQNELHIGISSQDGADLVWTGSTVDDGPFFLLVNNNSTVPVAFSISTQ